MGQNNISELFFFSSSFTKVNKQSELTNREQTTVKEGCWKAVFVFTKAYCEKTCEQNEPEIALFRGTNCHSQRYTLMRNYSINVHICKCDCSSACQTCERQYNYAKISQNWWFMRCLWDLFL